MTFNRYVVHLAVRSRLAVRRWSRRLMFVAGGVVVGLAAILMAFLADHAQAVFGRIVAYSPYLSLLVTPAGFALSIFLAVRVFPNSQGSGIPQVIAALRAEDRATSDSLVSLRTGIGKIIVMTLGLLCGASTGREGPTVQVGGAIMYTIGRWAPYRQSGFLVAGAAAGVAAAFNTPLAGIVFGIEELARSFETRTSGLIIAAVIAAGLTSLAIMGDYSYFGVTSSALPLGRAWVVVPVCAAICGLAGGLFSFILVLFTRGLPGRVGLAIKARPILFAALCGLGVALCGVLTGTHVFGTGYNEAKSILHGGTDVSQGYGALKFAATVLSAISGIPGGIFAPSLAIGGGIASDLRSFFSDIPIGALVLIGMVSYLTGVLQAPITAFVITSEMTNDHAMVIPLMASALIANGASKLILSEGLYHALAKFFLKKSLDAREIEPESTSRPDPAGA